VAVGEETRGPPGPEDSARSSADRLRERVAEARAAIARALREAVERLEIEEQQERAEAVGRLDQLAHERLGEIAAESARANEAARAGIEQEVSQRIGVARRELEIGFAQRVTPMVGELRDESARRLEAAEHALAQHMEERAVQVEARLRETTERELRAIREELSAGADQHAQELERHLERAAAERLAASVAELERTGEVRLSEETERLRAAVEQPTTALQEQEKRVARQIEGAAEKLSRGARRQELKLVRAESKKRIDTALTRLDERGAKLRDEIELRVREADRRIDETSTRLGDALARVQRSLSGIEEAERRLITIETRIGGTEQRVRDAAELARAAIDVDGRLLQAAAAEDEAARRIREAEERLRRTIDER
jgi:hypothetical protein